MIVKSILHKRMMELGRGEEGVALVVTLAVFMFMYIFCAGVFAVGKMVKDRICLQNAADAAAYSAAVVQADTLSRIATINRAMSWTYAQMNRRRMDYIMYRWLEHARDHYKQDRQDAADWVGKSIAHSPHYASRSTCYHGAMSVEAITLKWNESRLRHAIGRKVSASDSSAVNYKNEFNWTPVETEINDALSGYTRYFNTDADVVGSCYEKGGLTGIYGLEKQIDADMESIDKMNKKVLELREKMRDRIVLAAKEILRANIPDFKNCAYVVKTDSGAGYLQYMSNRAAKECEFHEWGNTDLSKRRYLHWDEDAEDQACATTLNGFYDYGAGMWFQPEWQFQGRHARRSHGFRWQYRGELTASWNWWAWYCSGCSYSYNYLTRLWSWTGYNPTRHPANSCSHSSDSREPCTHDPRRCTRILETCSTGASVLRNYRAKTKGGDYENREDGWILDCFYNPEKGRGALKENNRSRGGTDLIADPVALTKEFFTHAGTITVGVARPNANPWRDQYVLGKRDANIGLYHAFDPFLDWMVCFASARAGYKAVYDGEDMKLENRYCSARVANGPRDYCIDFKDYCGVARKVTDKWDDRYGWYKEVELLLPTWRQRWNLCQSDWDAVMIPVCRAGSGAFENLDTDFTYGYLREPCWTKMQSDYLYNLVMYGNWHAPESGLPFGGQWQDFRAGTGEPLEINDHGHVDYAPGDLAGLVGKLPERYHGWNADTVQRGGTTAIKWPYQWRVSGYGQRLDWMELQKQMLH